MDSTNLRTRKSTNEQQNGGEKTIPVQPRARQSYEDTFFYKYRTYLLFTLAVLGWLYLYQVLSSSSLNSVFFRLKKHNYKISY
jgi:hypothetical protein